MKISTMKRTGWGELEDMIQDRFTSPRPVFYLENVPKVRQLLRETDRETLDFVLQTDQPLRLKDGSDESKRWTKKLARLVARLKQRDCQRILTAPPEVK